MQHTSLSDQELVSKIASLCLAGRRLVARVVVHLIEVEDRGLDKKSACSSMWAFCLERLRMSESEARGRLIAAKLVRRFPSVLGRLERGDVHLSALRQLEPYLNEENVDAVLDEAKGKTRTQLEEMIARRFPRRNAPTVEIPVAPSMLLPTLDAMSPAARAPARPARVEPLSATGVLLQMTMSADGYADLKRAKELLGHSVPDGDTAKVIERALRTLVEDLEKSRRAKASRPRARVRPSKPGHISAATRREVFARDGEQCTYLDSEGRRCECRTRLEIDHIHPRALGGGDDASNLRARCRSHNLHTAEEIFGKEHVAAKIDCRQQQSMRRRGERREVIPPLTSSTSDIVEQATRGLVNMGFRVSEVRKTLVALVDHRGSGAPPLPELLREAIGALT
jgi:5-methylcytosine-specific restriction endonuclease McrA